jgi:hypothetical protein
MVPALDPGIEIYVRNKRPAEMKSFRPERTILFVHGATYPAHTPYSQFAVRPNKTPAQGRQHQMNRLWN